MKRAESSVIIDDVKIGKRLRALDPNNVRLIVQSIRECGRLLQPISVTKEKHLVYGFHRLAACKSLGWTEIPCNFFEGDALHAELGQIDENLCRENLTIVEEGLFWKRRDEILSEIGQRVESGFNGNRFTKVGCDKLSPPTPDNSSGVHLTPKTSQDLADELGVSKRTMQRRVEIARALPEDVQQKIIGTPLANNQSALKTLAGKCNEAKKAEGQGDHEHARTLMTQVNTIVDDVSKGRPLSEVVLKPTVVTTDKDGNRHMRPDSAPVIIALVHKGNQISKMPMQHLLDDVVANAALQKSIVLNAPQTISVLTTLLESARKARQDATEVAGKEVA